VFKEECHLWRVNLKEVNFKTMQSRLCQVFFAGEILDIDGWGFNFQSAWTTAWLAGQAMGRKRAGKVGKLGKVGRMKRISLLCVCAVQL